MIWKEMFGGFYVPWCFLLLFACFLFVLFLKEGAEQFLLAAKRTILCLCCFCYDLSILFAPI